MAQKRNSAIDGRTTRHTGYKVSLKKRELVEEIFGWSKTVGGLRKTRFIGLAKIKAQMMFTFAAYKPTRMATIFGWRLSTGLGAIRPMSAERYSYYVLIHAALRVEL